MKKVDKGIPGYFKYRKQVTMLAMISGFMLVFLFLVTGMLVTGDKMNLCTVAAAVAMLPTAKMTINFLMVPRHGKATMDEYNKLSSISDKVTILADILITPEKKNIELPYVAVDAENIVAFCDDAKLDKKYHSDFITRFIQVEGYSANVIIFDRLDKFEARVKELAKKNADGYDEAKAETAAILVHKMKLISI